MSQTLLAKAAGLRILLSTHLEALIPYILDVNDLIEALSDMLLLKRVLIACLNDGSKKQCSRSCTNTVCPEIMR